MTKREEFIEKYTDYDALGAWEIDVIPEMQRDLDDLIAAEIEAYERDQWKKYPENMPEIYEKVIFQDSDEYMLTDWITEDGILSTYHVLNPINVIAFRELPKPYEP